MEVILLERIEKLGQMGDIVKVKPGYARNYLLPQRKAVRATDENRARFEQQRSEFEASNLKQRAEAEALTSRFLGLTVTLIRQAGEAGQLYGSVNARDIAEVVSAAGLLIKRQQVRLAQPIKSLGLQQVSLYMHPEVALRVTVNVARSQEEAARQAETGQVVSQERESAEPEEAAIEERAKAMFEAGAAEHAMEELREDEAEERVHQTPAAPKPGERR